ncbi:hypothetical protein DESC_610338 [Desulfosarcina cetonica]|nr:hypothetical protein DESC_610338 [Desulfosarcina cetonica]
MLYTQFITHPIDGQNDFSAGQVDGDLLAQVLDMAVDGAVISLESISLHLVEEFAA